MSREEIEYLANEICVMRRTLTDLENKVNRCMWGPVKEPQGIITFKYPEDADKVVKHLQDQGMFLEKLLREHIENEIKEVDKFKETDRCNNHPDMMRYWDGMRVGYTNIRCWLDQRG